MDKFYNSLPESEYIYNSLFNSVIYACLLFFILLIPTFYLDKRAKRYYFILISFAFVFRIAFLTLNEYFQFIEIKKAGNFALWYYVLLKEQGLRALLEADITATFYPQLFFNWLGFEIFGASRINILLLNIFFSTLAAMIAFLSLRKLFDLQTANFGLFLFAIYPAAINFSAFGLRDPIIYCLVSANVLWLIDFYKNRTLKTFLLIASNITILLVLRPEIAAYLFIPFGFLFLIYWYNRKKGQMSSWLLLTLTSASIIIFSSLVYVFVIYYYGATSFVTPLQFMDTYVNWRFESLLRYGEPGSNILPADIYLNTHWVLKWILQSIGIVILPLPWLIKDIWKLLAFFDSVFLLYLVFIVWKFKALDKFSNDIIMVLFFTFFMTVIITGAIVSNAGNAFRIRLSFAPYLLISGAIALGSVNKKKHSIIHRLLNFL